MPPSAPLQPWGPSPEGCLSWQLQRLEGGPWGPCFWFDLGTKTKRKEFPIGLLSAELIAERWGSGVYRLHWFGAERSKGGVSPQFEIEADDVRSLYPNDPAHQKKVEAPAPVIDALAMFERIHERVRMDSDRQFERMRLDMAAQVERERADNARELERSREFYAQMARLTAAEGERAAALSATSAAESSKVQRALMTQLRELREDIEDLQGATGGGGAGVVADGAAGAPELPPGMLRTLAQSWPLIEKALPMLRGLVGEGG